MKLDNIAISALRAKLDNAKMSKMPWRLISTTEDGDTRTVIEVGGAEIAWAAETGYGHLPVTFDEDYAELAVSAVNALPGLLDYIDGMRAKLTKLRDQLFDTGLRGDAELVDLLLKGLA